MIATRWAVLTDILSPGFAADAASREPAAVAEPALRESWCETLLVSPSSSSSPDTLTLLRSVKVSNADFLEAAVEGSLRLLGLFLPGIDTVRSG